MNNRSLTYSITCVALLSCILLASPADAQVQTCTVPQVAYSPVVYNNYYQEGWYPGKYLGRFTRRVFGTAPAPATYQPVYAPAPVASQTTFAASYAPTANCCTTQTTFRPVVMQPVTQCTTCYAPSCDGCGVVTQAGYSSTIASDCATCATTSTVVESGSSSSAPSLPSDSSPPQTFREKPETDSLTPTPADESSLEEQNTGWDAPQLLDPNDKVTKRPTVPVWTAVYKQQQPAKITAVGGTRSSTANASTASDSGQTIGWKSGR